MIKLHFRGGGAILILVLILTQMKDKLHSYIIKKNQNIKFRREKVRRLQTTY